MKDEKTKTPEIASESQWHAIDKALTSHELARKLLEHKDSVIWTGAFLDVKKITGVRPAAFGIQLTLEPCGYNPPVDHAGVMKKFGLSQEGADSLKEVQYQYNKIKSKPEITSDEKLKLPILESILKGRKFE